MKKPKDKGMAVSVLTSNLEINTTIDTGTGTSTSTSTSTADETITAAGNSSQSNDNLKDWSSLPVPRLPSRNTSSKYDFVKVNFVFPFNSLLLCWVNWWICKKWLNFSLISRSFLISCSDSPRNSTSLFLYIYFFKFLFDFLLHVVACVVLWQVKVWLGDNADHYYVLSRFLLSRMLTVTKVQEHPNYIFWNTFLLSFAQFLLNMS